MKALSLVLLLCCLASCKTVQSRSHTSAASFTYNEKTYFLFYEYSRFDLYTCTTEAVRSLGASASNEQWKASCPNKIKSMTVDEFYGRVRSSLFFFPDRAALLTAKEEVLNRLLLQIAAYEKRSGLAATEINGIFDGLSSDNPNRSTALSRQNTLNGTLDELKAQAERLQQAIQDSKDDPSKNTLVEYDLNETVIALGRTGEDLASYLQAIMDALRSPTQTFRIDPIRQNLLYKALTADVTPTPIPVRPKPAPVGKYDLKPQVSMEVVEPTSMTTSVTIQLNENSNSVHTYTRASAFLRIFDDSKTDCCQSEIVEGNGTWYIDRKNFAATLQKITGILRVEKIRHSKVEYLEMKDAEVKQANFLKLYDQLTEKSVVYTAYPGEVIVTIVGTDFAKSMPGFDTSNPDIYLLKDNGLFPSITKDLLNAVPQANRRKLAPYQYDEITSLPETIAY